MRLPTRPILTISRPPPGRGRMHLAALAPPGRGRQALPGHRMHFASIAGPGDLEDWDRRVAAGPPQESCRPGNWFAQFAGEPPAPRIPMTAAASAGRVGSCVKTGNNGFFVPAPDAARERGIAGRFLRPVLSRGDADGCLKGREARECIFAADMSKGDLSGAADGAGALRHMEEAEATLVAPRRGSDRAERRMRRLASVRGRASWYSLGLRGAPPPILLSISRTAASGCTATTAASLQGTTLRRLRHTTRPAPTHPHLLFIGVVRVAHGKERARRRRRRAAVPDRRLCALPRARSAPDGARGCGAARGGLGGLLRRTGPR